MQTKVEGAYMHISSNGIFPNGNPHLVILNTAGIKKNVMKGGDRRLHEQEEQASFVTAASCLI